MTNVSDRNEPGALAHLQASLGSSIRSRRRHLKITQEELAWRANLHRTYIADVERGVRNVTLRTVGQLAQALDVSVVELMAAAAPDDSGGQAAALGEILLIEDNPTDAELAMRALRRSRLRNPIRMIGDGEAALIHLLGREDGRNGLLPLLPQLVLLDLHLPKVSGLEVLARLRADRRTAALPVAVLTVSDHEGDIQACRDLGVDHYIIKPVTAAALGQVVVESGLGWALIRSALPEAAVPGRA